MISIRKIAIDQLLHIRDLVVGDLPYASRYSAEAYEEALADLEKVDHDLLLLGVVL